MKTMGDIRRLVLLSGLLFCDSQYFAVIALVGKIYDRIAEVSTLERQLVGALPNCAIVPPQAEKEFLNLVSFCQEQSLKATQI